MERSPYLDVFKKQKEVWSDLITAFELGWKRSLSSDWRIDPLISSEEVLADLTYGRD